MLVNENICSESQEDYRIKLEPITEVFTSEERSITLENGGNFTYKFHLAKERSEEASDNLVVFIPGAEHNGEEHLNEAAQRSQHAFNSVTFSYPKLASIDNVSQGLIKVLGEQPSRKIVLHGSSYGGAVLHRVMEQIDDPQLLEKIAGVIYECGSISKESLSPAVQRAIAPNKKLILQAAAAMRTPKLYGTGSQKGGSNTLVDMIYQIPDNVLAAHGNYPRRAIVFDQDRMINNESLISTLAKESGVDAENIGIVVESKKSDKWGHSPESWGKVHNITAKLIDEFLN